MVSASDMYGPSEKKDGNESMIQKMVCNSERCKAKEPCARKKVPPAADHLLEAYEEACTTRLSTHTLHAIVI